MKSVVKCYFNRVTRFSNSCNTNKFQEKPIFSCRFFSTSKNDDLTHEFQAKHLLEVIQLIKKKVEKNKIKERLEVLDKELKEPNLWNDQSRAAKLHKEHSQLNRVYESLQTLENSYKQYSQLIEFSKEDKEYLEEAEKIIKSSYEEAQELEIQALMSNEGDSNGCFLEVQAGAGGKDSMDWASILLNMYTKWANRNGMQSEIVEETFGEVGLRSATLKIEGGYGYGWLKHETGVHRLIRISPFDSTGKRHTSFASVFVSPLIDQSIHLVIDKKDLKIDTYRSSGPGGQHVNTTDSAVRITHLPTGIIAKAQNERSQHHQDCTTWKLKRGANEDTRFFDRFNRERDRQELRSGLGENTFGNQIRTYTMQPYQLVKDARTGAESSNISDVLEGGEHLHNLLKASLLANIE